ncbi:hypothetical protein [Paraburkholderia bannensis]|uniref:hypothetical protein n=1 Tax=Paraburkholderia bannensis TaxID=765414 RepID=UPI002ABE1FE3|nr:hypothetical protein [Paraburkholderia bannensis]
MMPDRLANRAEKCAIFRNPCAHRPRTHALEIAAQIGAQRQTSNINQESKAACRLCAGDIRAALADVEGSSV